MTEERTGILTTVVEGPRWCKMERESRDAAFMRGVTVKELTKDKGWIFESIRLKVTGTESQLRSFVVWFREFANA